MSALVAPSSSAAAAVFASISARARASRWYALSTPSSILNACRYSLSASFRRPCCSASTAWVYTSTAARGLLRTRGARKGILAPDVEAGAGVDSRPCPASRAGRPMPVTFFGETGAGRRSGDLVCCGEMTRVSLTGEVGTGASGSTVETSALPFPLSSPVGGAGAVVHLTGPTSTAPGRLAATSSFHSRLKRSSSSSGTAPAGAGVGTPETERELSSLVSISLAVAEPLPLAGVPGVPGVPPAPSASDALGSERSRRCRRSDIGSTMVELVISSADEHSK